MSAKDLHRFNDLLSVILVCLASYIFLLPVIPQASWWWHHSVPVVSRSTRQSVINTPVVAPVIPLDNRLDIPALGLDEHLYEGKSVYTVNKGVWARPNGSTPDKGGNTVLVGHRFTYTNPRGVFYYLDKLRLGDSLTVYWQNHTYVYQVQNLAQVTSNDTMVEAPTTDSRLTLYTCTPLWSLKDRLVVVARLVRIT
jgi:LPXTG-site transpeptidase (sortase) family protein